MLHMLYIATCFGLALLGAALLILWMAIEVIGYGGMLVCIAIRRGWIVLPSASTRIRKTRDVRWGVAVRAAGMRPRTS
jgi:hypothetical protein